MGLLHASFPFSPGSVSLILANYALMFLNPKERNVVVDNINYVAQTGCKLVVELYPAKDSFAKTGQEIVKLRDSLIKKLNRGVNSWTLLRCSKDKFIAEKTIL